MVTTTADSKVLDMFVAWGKQHESVRAMILTSSHTTTKAPVDVFSDYDLILIVTDVQPYFDDRAWLGDFGPVLVTYRDPLQVEEGLKKTAYVTQYENGLKIDFSVWPVELLQRIVASPGLPDEFDAGYLVILDKDRLADALPAPTYTAYIPKPPTETQYHDLIEWFFLDTIYVAKFLWRDDIMAAKHLLDYYIKQDYLRPMLEWITEIDHNWMVKPGPYGRRMKLSLRPDLWSELETTYTGAEVAANWDALFRSIALFHQVAVEVGAHFGYVYLNSLEQRVLAYIHKVKKLDRAADKFD